MKLESKCENGIIVFLNKVLGARIMKDEIRRVKAKPKGNKKA